jgi:hypothetical protein
LGNNKKYLRLESVRRQKSFESRKS